MSFKGQSASGVADIDGKWTLKLAPMEADAAGAEMQVKTATERKVLKDILVGEVWLCSGQSNMQFALREVQDGKEQVAAAKHPQIRLLTISAPPSARFSPTQSQPAASLARYSLDHSWSSQALPLTA